MKKHKIIIFLFQIVVTIYLISSLKPIHEIKELTDFIKWGRILLVFSMFSILLTNNKRFKLICSKRYLLLYLPLIFNFYDLSEPIYVDYFLMLLTMLILYNIDYQSINSIIYTSATIYVLFISVLIFLFYTQAININEVTQVGTRIRNSIGFYNSNASGLFLGISILGLAYTKKHKLLIYALLLSICIFYFTNTRSIIVMTFLGLLYFFATKYLKGKNPFYYLSYTMTFFSFSSPILIHKLLYYEVAGIPLNTLASERLMFADSQLNSYTLHQLLFGNFKTQQIDNFFINMLSTTGVITYILIIIYTFFSIRRNKQNSNNLFLIFSFMLIGNIESYFSSANIITIIFLFLITKHYSLNEITTSQINENNFLLPKTLNPVQ